MKLHSKNLRQSLDVLSDTNLYLGEYGAVQQALKEPAIRQFAQEACDTTGYTPDVVDIFKQKYQPLFVYDSLQKFMPDHEMLDGGLFMGTSYTVNNNFTLFKKRNPDAYPIPLLTPFSDTRNQIMGELYLIKSETLLTIDEFKTNTVYHNRIKMQVYTPWRLVSDTGKITPKFIMQKFDAWVYIGSSRAFKERIENNAEKYDICDVFSSPVSKTHYVFNSMDLEVP